MKYEIVEPEVIVGLGKNTTFKEKQPPFKTIEHLHIELEDWLGDDLMVNSNCYIVTEQFKETLEKSNYSGFRFEEMELTKTAYLDNNYHISKPLPVFYWMKITGQKGVDDLFNSSLELFMSDRLLSFVIENFQMKYLDINPSYDKETDDFIKGLIKKDLAAQKEERNKTIYKTFKGKNYTKEEWEAYEKEQRDKSKDKN